MLAHVFEEAGLSTIAFSLVRGQIEKVHPPRALHCEFPLGRPLGKPGDAEFQRRVLMAAFDLLTEPSGPALRDFPEKIDDEADEPLACPLPPREDPSLPEAVDEARALRPAYERTLARLGRTAVGRAVDAAGVPEAIAAFVKIAEGAPWKEAGVPGHPLDAAKDVMNYYEEAALALVDHTPAARSAESWFYRKTAAGAALKAARKAMRDQGAKFSFYLIPFTQ